VSSQQDWRERRRKEQGMNTKNRIAKVRSIFRGMTRDDAHSQIPGELMELSDVALDVLSGGGDAGVDSGPTSNTKIEVKFTNVYLKTPFGDSQTIKRTESTTTTTTGPCECWKGVPYR
jgi:hypothetical protein